MHSGLLPVLLAPGTAPTLQLPTLDMTQSLRGLEVQIHTGTVCVGLGPLLCPLGTSSLSESWSGTGED